jgi:hypothetical protein
MARNVALFGAREIQDKRRFVTGVTASMPRYQEADETGNKEWVVDVYLGPLEGAPSGDILESVPLAPYARQLVSGLQQPVTLERSRQGGYTVIGRAKVLSAGTLSPDGDVYEPTYHLVRHNLADLRVRHIADLDYDLEPLQATPDTPLQADPDEPLQRVTATDAFGNRVLGGSEDDPALAIAPETEVTTRHVRITPAKLGPPGDPLAMQWGVSILQPTYQEIVEFTV